MSTGLNPWELITEPIGVQGPRVGQLVRTETLEERVRRLEKERTWATVLAVGLIAWQIYDHMRIEEIAGRRK